MIPPCFFIRKKIGLDFDNQKIQKKKKTRKMAEEDFFFAKMKMRWKRILKKKKLWRWNISEINQSINHQSDFNFES